MFPCIYHSGGFLFWFQSIVIVAFSGLSFISGVIIGEIFLTFIFIFVSRGIM